MLSQLLPTKKFALTFLLPALIHIVAGVLILWHYHLNGALRWEAMPIHFLIGASFFGLMTGLSVLFYRIQIIRKRTSALISGLLIIAAAVWFIIQHFTSFIGYLFWSDEVTFSRLFEYLPHLTTLLDHLGFSVIAFTLSAIIIILLLIVGYFFWCRSVYRYLTRFTFISPKLSNRGVLILTAISAIPLIFYAFSIHSNKMLSLRGEPFADAFRSGHVFDLRFKPTNPDLSIHINSRENFRDSLPVEFDEKHVILIMMDAGRADHMSVYGYDRPTTPFLDSLMSTGHLLKTSFAVTPCPQSECGITAMLSSQFYPRVHQASYTMQEAMHDLGYQTHFILSGDHSRVFPFMRRFYGDYLTSFYDGMMSGEYPNNDQLVLDYLKEVLGSQEELPPSMFYLHLMSTHLVSARYPQYQYFEPHDFRRQIPTMAKGRHTPLTDDELQLIRNNYDNGMLQTDSFIRRIFEQLDERGILDNAVVIITSDHGEALGDRGLFGHAQHIHFSTINIPLLVYDRSKELSEDHFRPAFGNLIDIPTTVFSRLGLMIPGSWEGVNLLEETRTVSHHLSTFHSGNQSVIIHHEDQFFMLDYSRPDSKATVYNLTEDPMQEEDLWDSIDPDILERLIEAYNEEFEPTL